MGFIDFYQDRLNVFGTLSAAFNWQGLWKTQNLGH
jgi:hypothetical protein